VETSLPIEYSQGPFGSQDSLAYLFHLNTKLVPSLSTTQLTQEQLSSGLRGINVKQLPSAQKIRLPEKDLEPTLSLAQAIRTRRSTYTWEEKAISQAQLGTLLRLGAGIVQSKLVDGKMYHYRAAPSGGARYPIEIYPVIFNVAGFAPGIYHYSYLDHALEVLYCNQDIKSTVLTTTFYQDFIEKAGVIFLLTAVFERTMYKYSDRGYRYILLEAGHIAQNICLLATSLQLGTLCLGGVYEQKIEPLLWIDGFSESLIYVVAAGHEGER
jgi:SagB-type dehydrogenase family enzyme